MRCPVCNYKSTRVVDSRLGADGMSDRRRRESVPQRCVSSLSTVEVMERLDVTVVKRNGKREGYSREKLVVGLKRSLEKRPYTDTELQNIVHNLERDIQKVRGGEITTLEIGDIVMKHLKTFDKVAYIRFASVYLSFEDVNRFEKELKSLKKTK